MNRSAAQHGTATIHEIFSGIQGEGILVGVRQLFVRFHGCHVACAFCDTPASRAAPPAACTVERHAGGRQLAAYPNPIGAAELLAFLQELEIGYPHHSVSLTGGEPLLQRAFLDDFLPALHAAGLALVSGDEWFTARGDGRPVEAPISSPWI